MPGSSTSSEGLRGPDAASMSGRPRWVKIGALVALLIVVAIVVLVLLGGGPGAHGPGPRRH